MKKKIPISLILLLLTVLASTAKMNAGGQETPRHGGTLIWAMPADPQSLNPALSTASWGQHACSNTFQGLTSHKMAPNGDWIQVPVLAESWEMSLDGLSYTYHLVQNATWHDGEPFTSADVKFSFENVLMQAAAKSTWKYVESIETPDDYTVIFHLNQIYAPFATFMTYMYGAIVPKHIYTHDNGTIFSIDEIKAVQFDLAYVIGTGPFMLKEYVKGDHLTLERNPNYFKASLPYLDKIIMKIIPNPEMRTQAIKSGEVDFIPQQVGTAIVDELNTTEGLAVTNKGMEYSGPTYLMYLNVAKSPILSNKLVRHALSHAIDRDEMSTLATNGYHPPGTTSISSELPFWHNPNVREPWYNVTRANELLDEAGYPKGTDGIRFSLTFQWDTTYSTEVTKVAEVLRDHLGTVGIDLELVPMDNPTFFEATYINHDFDMAMWTSGSGPDPSVRLDRTYRSTGYLTPASYVNPMGYNNTEVDALFDAAAVSLDPMERQQMFWQIQEILVDDLPIINALEKPSYTVYRTTYEGLVQYSLWGFRDTMESVWWTGAVEPAEGIPVEWIAAIAGVIVIVVVATVYLMRRKRAH